MKSLTASPLTVEDYRTMPATGPRYQLIEGDLYMAPAPNRYHQDISLNIEFLLSKYLEKHPIGRIYHAPFDVYFDEINVHQPDIIYLSKNRSSILTAAGAEGPPDLVVEILSPRTAHLDKNPKRLVFARCGVEELWIIDPKAKSISVYRLQEDPDKPQVIYHEKDVFETRHFPGLKIGGAVVFKA